MYALDKNARQNTKKDNSTITFYVQASKALVKVSAMCMLLYELLGVDHQNISLPNVELAIIQTSYCILLSCLAYNLNTL